MDSSTTEPASKPPSATPDSAGATNGSKGSAEAGNPNLDGFEAALAELSLGDIGQASALPREPRSTRFAVFAGQHHIFLLSLCVLLLWVVTALPPLWQQQDYRLGAEAADDIIAPHTAMLPDRAETHRKREAVAALVPPEYDGNPLAQDQALTQLRSIIAVARREAIEAASAPSSASRIASSGRTSPSQQNETRQAQQAWVKRVQRLQSRLNSPLPNDLVPQVLAVSATRWDVVRRVAERAVHAVYAGGQVRSDVAGDLAAAQTRVANAIRGIVRSTPAKSTARLSPTEVEVAMALARHVARRPNLVVNERATERARQKARSEVRDIYQRIESGTPLVLAGDVITEEKWVQLQEMGLVAPGLDWRLALAWLALCTVLVGSTARYLTLFHPGVIQRPTALWLAALVPIVFLAVFRLLLRVPHADFLMVPLSMTTAMLLTILLDARIGMLIGFVVAVLCAMMGRAEAGLLLTAALSSWIGALSVSNIVSRGQLLRASFLLMVINAVLTAAFGALREMPIEEMNSIVRWNAAVGLFSVFATAGLAMLLERPFGITTHLRLLELLSPDELVMRRMQTEAPGTYTHSLMVATLSEAAAKTIGADPLLCRVASLYHDIGKLRRPHCFVENQTGDNIHDRLAPQLSARIIRAHVEDGLELGRALHLPQPILDIIAQHHGTSLIGYFYQRALQEVERIGDGALSTVGDANSQIADEASFRYPGPRPQSKEAAIVMLADTVEASSRALPDPTPERVAQHIKSMIALRLQEGEFSESEVTLRDLTAIEKSFVHVLRGVLHHRIEYPDPNRDAEDKMAAGGKADGWVREALTDGRSGRLSERGRSIPRRTVQPQSTQPPGAPSQRTLSRRERRAALRAESSPDKHPADPATKTAPVAKPASFPSRNGTT